MDKPFCSKASTYSAAVIGGFRYRSRIPSNGGAGYRLVKANQMGDERVRVLGLNAEGLELLGREVVEIDGDDHIGLSHDCCGQDVAVIAVGQMESRNHVFVADNQAIFDTLVDEREGPRDTLRSSRVFLQELARPFCIDQVSPSRAEQVGPRQVEQ